MNKKKQTQFVFNWILKNQLAVGTSPTKEENLVFLKDKNIKNIIALCSDEDIHWNKNIYKQFNCNRIVLPDSRDNILPEDDDLKLAFRKLRSAISEGVTFIHCYASIERSPLLCIMFIMYKYNLNVEEALDYVKNVHSFTNPTNKQLNLIKKFMDSL